MTNRIVRAWVIKSARRRLREARREVEKGDGLAVICALKICAIDGLLIPAWLRKEFVARVGIVLDEKAKSWDDGFGKPWPGVHRNTLKSFQRDLIRVHEKIHEKIDALPAGKKLGFSPDFFAQVGEELKESGTKLSGTKVAELWYQKAVPLKIASDLRKKAKIPVKTKR